MLHAEIKLQYNVRLNTVGCDNFNFPVLDIPLLLTSAVQYTYTSSFKTYELLQIKFKEKKNKWRTISIWFLM